MNIIITILSKYPNSQLYQCIKNLYLKQINVYPDKHKYVIHVVDSDSDNFIYYQQVQKDFPDVTIHFIKNKNYEYGAFKYISEKYQYYDIYFCIQDSLIVTSYIDIDIVNDKNAYTIHHYSGYNSHPIIKETGIKILENSNLEYKYLIDTNFNLALHSAFIVNNSVIKDIFTHFKIPPTDKFTSCTYERNYGIFFICKNINTIDLDNHIIKINGGRK